MTYLRTPDHHFEQLPDFPYAPHYVNINGLRMHYLDEGEGEVVLCLHGEPSWSFLYRKFFPILAPHFRVIAPDWIGFGRSDKLPKVADYSYEMHADFLEQFIKALGLKEITLVVQDWGGLLGLGMLGKHPDRFKRVVIMNTFLPIGEGKPPIAFKAWKLFVKMTPSLPVGRVLKMGTVRAESKTREVIAAYDAPFPNRYYKAGVKAFPALVPMKPTDPGVEEMKRAREVLGSWQKPALILFSDKDPITGFAAKYFRKTIPTAKDQPEITIENAGHFLQEDAGEEIATHILEFMKRTFYTN